MVSNRRGGLAGPGLYALLAVLLFLAFAPPPASAVYATLKAETVVLGSNLTLTIDVDQCLNCTSAIVAVNGKVVAKPAIAEDDTKEVEIPTNGNASACGAGCIPAAGSYRAAVWVVADTVPGDTADPISVGDTVGSEINSKPPDAVAGFFVSPASLTASLSAKTIVEWQDATLSGDAPGISRLAVWAFDKGGTLSGGQCFYRVLLPGGDDDEKVGGPFTWTIDRSITAKPGGYTIFLLSPGPDNTFQNTGSSTPPYAPASNDTTCSASLYGDGGQVLSRLKDAADPIRTDDTYQIFTLQVERSQFRLDPIGVAYLNDTLAVSGRTNKPSATVQVRVLKGFFEVQGVASVSNGQFSATFDTSASNGSARTWEPGTYSVIADDGQGNSDTITFELVPKRPAQFEVSNLVVLAPDGKALDGRTPALGQSLTAQAVLLNKGDSAGNVTLYFQLSGRNLCSPASTVNPGQSVIVNCTFTVNHSGSYVLRADGRSVPLNVPGPGLPEVAGQVKPISTLQAGGQARLLFSGAVEQVVLDARAPVAGAQIVVQPLSERPAGLSVPPGVPFQFFRLTSVNLPDSAVGALTVQFRVDGSWLSGNNLKGDTVRLYRAITTQATPTSAAQSAWRVESTSRLGSDGGSDVVYQSKVAAFGDFAIVGGSTEGVLAAPGEGGPLALLTNLPVMAAIAGGAGAGVFFFLRWRRSRRGAPEAGAPGVPLPEGAAAALPASFVEEALSLFRQSQPGPAFRRVYDEVASALKASLGVEGNLSSRELLSEAEAKGFDSALLASIDQLFSTCDAARFSGIPPTEEHIQWALRAARSIIARMTGTAPALPSTIPAAGGEAAPGGPDFAANDNAFTLPGAPAEPPAGPAAGGEMAAGPPEEPLPGPGEPKNGNGNGKNGNGHGRKRRRRRGGGGNGNGNGAYPPHGNGNGNGGNGNGGHPPDEPPPGYSAAMVGGRWVNLSSPRLPARAPIRPVGFGPACLFPNGPGRPVPHAPTPPRPGSGPAGFPAVDPGAPGAVRPWPRVPAPAASPILRAPLTPTMPGGNGHSNGNGHSSVPSNGHSSGNGHSNGSGNGHATPSQAVSTIGGNGHGNGHSSVPPDGHSNGNGKHGSPLLPAPKAPSNGLRPASPRLPLPPLPRLPAIGEPKVRRRRGRSAAAGIPGMGGRTSHAASGSTQPPPNSHSGGSGSAPQPPTPPLRDGVAEEDRDFEPLL